jgi:hypothetical protein
MAGDMTSATKEVIVALKPLVVKLGESAQQVFQYAVKDAVITGHLKMYGCWTCVGMGIFLWLLGMWALFRSKSIESNEGSFFCFFIGALSFMGAMAFYCSAQYYILNPEYTALQDLLMRIK